MISSSKTIFKILNYLLRIFNLVVFLFLTSIIIGDAISNFDDLSLITDNLCFLIGCFEVASKAFKFSTEYKKIMLLIKDIYEPFDMLRSMDSKYDDCQNTIIYNAFYIILDSELSRWLVIYLCM